MPPTAPPDCPPVGRAVLAAVVVAAGALAGLQLTAQIASGTSSVLLAVDVTVAVLGVGLTPVLVRRPVLGGVLVSSLAVLSPVATPVATMAAFHVARWRSFTDAAVVAGIGVCAHVLLGLWRPTPGIGYGWYLLLVVATYAGLVGWGAWSRARRQLVASLAERARRAEAEQAARVAEGRALERERLAREMHDVLAHRLSLLATYAGALEYRPDSCPERLAQAAGVVRAGLHEALQELREVIALLRDDTEPEDAGLTSGAGGPGSLRPLPTLLDLPRLVEECRAAGMEVSLDGAAAVEQVPVRIGRAAYRVVQEGLTNARRHAPGRPAAVRVSTPVRGTLEVRVRNPLGPGRPQDDTRGHGLVGLTERVGLLGGALAHGEDGGAFWLRATFRWVP